MVTPPFYLEISPIEEGREGLGLVEHVGGEHLGGDGPDVPRVVDEARGDRERIAGAQGEGRPVVQLHIHVAPHDVADFVTGMVVAAGGYALGDLDDGLGYVPPEGGRGEALQLGPLERGWLVGPWLGGHLILLTLSRTRATPRRSPSGLPPECSGRTRAPGRLPPRPTRA